MKPSWKVAVDIMKGFYNSRRQEWPALAAQRLMPMIRVRGSRWVSAEDETEAAGILNRALFDVDELAEDYLGIRISRPLLKRYDDESGKLLGYSLTETPEIAACRRTLAYRPLYRTTIMHEVGHQMLHIPCVIDPVAGPPAAHIVASREREAYDFMRVTLLPKPILKLAIAYIAHVQAIPLDKVLVEANTNPGHSLWRRHIFRPVINKLCVSRAFVAVAMRKSLGVFTESTVRYHRKYALDNHWRTKAYSPPRGDTLGEILTNSGVLARPLSRRLRATSHRFPRRHCAPRPQHVLEITSHSNAGSRASVPVLDVAAR